MLHTRWARHRALGVLLLGCYLSASGCSGDTSARHMTYIQQASTYSADGKYAEAIIALKNALQLQPQDARAYYQLGLAYLKRGKGVGDVQEAFRALSQSVELDATNLDAHLKLGELFLLSRQWEKAQ